MLITERLTINGKEFIRTYSDSGLLIERDGVLYSEAIDPADSGRAYTESDKAIGYVENTCICCGAVIPEGRQVCPNCEEEQNNSVESRP